MYFFLIFTKSFLFIISSILHQVESKTTQMVITNNGPAILDSEITFEAEILQYETKNQLTYIFDDGIEKSEYKSRSSNITITKHFSQNLYSEGTYIMQVSVTSKEFFMDVPIAKNSTKFHLSGTLIGQINIYQGNQTAAIDIDEVAVGENISFVLNLIDNANYLQDAIVDYGWSVDFEKHYSLGNTLFYNFSNAGYKDIKAIVTASFPNNDFKIGTFERVINAKVPVNHVNVSGNPFLYHGDKLYLNISCNGTPPFTYCYEILNRSISSENFTCTKMTSFTSCHMEIIKYFQDDGKYYIGIYLSNNVKEIKRVFEIMVYSVTVEPTLSTVIIPIVCSLLALIILAVGISHCIQQRNKFVVEVANFNFQEESDSYPEQTFFEQILDSFTCRNCRHPSCMVQSETDPLI